MVSFDWVARLREWNDRLLACDLADELPADVRAAKWLGEPPANDEQIAAVERRLKIPLPPSYRAFLQVANGWRRLTSAIAGLWGTEQVRWFRRDHSDWIKIYSGQSSWGPRDETPDIEYFSYESPEDFRAAHMKETLQVSPVGDAAVLLLNPQVIDAGGEWEAWYFANWLPGVRRFRSFAELIDSEYHNFFNLPWKQRVGLDEPLPSEYQGALGSSRRRLKKRRRPKVLKVLDKPVGRWDFAELLQLLRHEEWTVRQEVAEVLGKLNDPRAIEPLLQALDDDSNACVSAMYALRRLAPERLREPLVEMLQRRHFCSFAAAATVLAELNEPRAVPILAEILRDVSPRSQHTAQQAGPLLAQFGTAGFTALVSLLDSGDPAVRRRAATAILYAQDNRSADVYQQLLKDADPAIRESAELGLKVINAPRQPH